VNYTQIATFVRRVAYTCEAELDCGECSQLTPQYVDAVLSGQDHLDRWAHVRQHLEQCTVCSQETVTLYNIAQMELDGTWPPLAQLLEWVVRRELSA
jgi:hypothetical protein